MDKVLVINLTTITQHVGVIHENGRNDYVQIVPRRRVELRPGMVVDPAWLGRNPGAVRVVAPTGVSPTVAAHRSSGPVTTVGGLQPDGQAGALTVADVESNADSSANTTNGEAQ
jgi:hypothetical protein